MSPELETRHDLRHEQQNISILSFRRDSVFTVGYCFAPFCSEIVDYCLASFSSEIADYRLFPFLSLVDYRHTSPTSNHRSRLLSSLGRQCRFPPRSLSTIRTIRGHSGYLSNGNHVQVGLETGIWQTPYQFTHFCELGLLDICLSTPSIDHHL